MPAFVSALAAFVVAVFACVKALPAFVSALAAFVVAVFACVKALLACVNALLTVPDKVELPAAVLNAPTDILPLKLPVAACSSPLNLALPAVSI